MVSGKQGIRPRFGPSNRILELAQHKTSKTVWATTPCEKLSWGNQEPIRPVSSAALGATPSARIQYLARHKRDFSAREDHRSNVGHWSRKRKSEQKKKAKQESDRASQAKTGKQQQEEEEEEEEVSFFRTTRQRPSSRVSHYEHIVHLSTPKPRSCRTQEGGPPHTPHCETNCPIWHVKPRAMRSVLSLHLLQLSNPKVTHPDFQSNRERVESTVSFASKTAQISQRLTRLSLPRLKESNTCCKLGRPEESIWTVSRAAKKASVSARVEMLASPKQLSKDYIPPREAEWSRRDVLLA